MTDFFSDGAKQCVFVTCPGNRGDRSLHAFVPTTYERLCSLMAHSYQ